MVLIININNNNNNNSNNNNDINKFTCESRPILSKISQKRPREKTTNGVYRFKFTK